MNNFRMENSRISCDVHFLENIFLKYPSRHKLDDKIRSVRAFEGIFVVLFSK